MTRSRVLLRSTILGSGVLIALAGLAQLGESSGQVNAAPGGLLPLGLLFAGCITGCRRSEKSDVRRDGINPRERDDD